MIYTYFLTDKAYNPLIITMLENFFIQPKQLLKISINSIPFSIVVQCNATLNSPAQNVSVLL